MKYLQRVAILFFVLISSGCANYASPTAVNGSFYMIGDETCLRGYQNEKLLEQKRILCINKNGDITGYRNAMTPQEIQMWQFNQQMALANQQMALEQSNNIMMQNQLQQMNNNMQQFNNQMMFRNMMMMSR